MDFQLQLKRAGIMMRYITHDLAGVGREHYYPKKLPYAEKPGFVPLPRSTPEREGLKSAAIERLIRKMDASPTVAPHGLIVMRHGKVVAEAHWAPYRAQVPHMLYSVSKSVTGTAIGMAVEEGILSLDDKLSDIFADLWDARAERNLKHVTIRHLLTMSVGIRFDEIGSAVAQEWERMYLESRPRFKAGERFEYNSMNTYMLAAALKRRAGVPMTEYLRTRLYEPLGIANYDWELCPDGIEKGGWGLALTLEDAAKIGQLYLNGGVWNVNGEQRRLLSEEWVRESTGNRIDTPDGECRCGYGYQIWVSPIKGGYQFNGAYGQYIIMLPQYDAVVAVNGGAANLFPESKLDELVQEFFAEGCTDTHCEENAEDTERLAALVKGLRLSAFPALEGATDPAGIFPAVCGALSGREYRAEKNIASVFTMSLQSVHSNYTEGIGSIRFAEQDGALLMTFREGEEENTLALYADDAYHEQHIIRRGEDHLVGVRTEWHMGEDGIALRVTECFMETPYTRVFTATLHGEDAYFAFDELPDGIAVTALLFDLANMKMRGLLKRFLPRLKARRRNGKPGPLGGPEFAAKLVHE